MGQIIGPVSFGLPEVSGDRRHGRAEQKA
jgi:hypothetical protein